MEPTPFLPGQLAERVTDFLYGGLKAMDFVGVVKTRYLSVWEEMELGQNGKRPVEHGPEDEKRILLELLYFSAFLCLKAAPSYIGRRALFRWIPDIDRCSQFAGQLIASLERLAQEHGFAEVPSVQSVPAQGTCPEDGSLGIDVVPGDPITPDGRIDDYFRWEEAGKGNEYRWFSKYLGRAVDANHYVFIDPFLIETTKPLLLLVKEVMESVFRHGGAFEQDRIYFGGFEKQ